MDMLVICLALIGSSVNVGLVLRLLVNSRRLSHSVNADEPDTLPSLSVCIPARNETHALSDCLERVLASDYEKLEILVLDDQSDDDTSLLIKSFAHAGVRFIAGKSLSAGWLGKNYALETLMNEASGDVLVFMDVDTMIRPTTLRRLVKAYRHGNLDMLSVIPRRPAGHILTMAFGHLRYMWEIVLGSFVTPPSASALWLVDRQALLTAGGFAPFASHTQPESVLARSFSRIGRYQCLLDSDEFGITYEKRWSSQIETSQRLLFPKLTTTFGAGVLATVAFIGWLAAIGATIAALVVWSVVSWWAAVAYALAALFFYRYARLAWVRYAWLAALVWPYTVLQELVLLMMSTVRHLTRTVTWKGRSVTAENRNIHYLMIDE